MNEILSSELWPRIRKLAKTAQRKSAAVAYVTDDRFVIFGEGDILVTDASDEAIKSGQTSASVLKAALRRKAQLASVPGLHSKVYVFGRCAIIGSANLSRESERRTEAALLTDQPTVVSSAKLFIEQLRADGDEIDSAFISRISKLPVAKRKVVPNGQRRRHKREVKPRSWLVRLHRAVEKDEEQNFVEEGREEAEKHVSHEGSSVSSLRFRGKTRFRREAKEGDVVVQIWSEPSKGKPESVYRHAPIILKKHDKANDVTWFYIEEYPDADETALTWKQFQRLYSQIGIPRKLSRSPTREIAQHHSDALHALWLT